MAEYPGPDRRAPCDRCDMMREDANSKMAKLFDFMEDQLGRNEACDQQISAHEKDITEMKREQKETNKNVISPMATKINRAVGGLIVLTFVSGFLCSMALYIVKDAAANTKQKIEEVRKIAASAHAQADRAYNDAQLMKPDIIHIKETIDDVKKNQKEQYNETKLFYKEIISYLEKNKG